MSRNWRIKKSGITAQEILQVAELHRAEFPTGVLSSLGASGLAAVYRYFSTSRNSTLIVAVEPETGTVGGFISAVLSRKRLWFDLLRRCPRVVLIQMFPRMLSPRRLLKAVEVLLYLRGDERLALPDAEAWSMAVGLQHRRQGLAYRMWCEMAAYFRERGVRTFRGARGDDQLLVRGFHERVGGKIVGATEVHKGTRSEILVFDVDRVAKTADRKHD